MEDDLTQLELQVDNVFEAGAACSAYTLHNNGSESERQGFGSDTVMEVDRDGASV